MDSKNDALVACDIYTQTDDKQRFYYEFMNESCRREGLPARWWYFKQKKKENKAVGFCLKNSKIFIQGSSSISERTLDYSIYHESKKTTWRELLAEANVCFAQNNFWCIDLDTDDISILEKALDKANQNRYGVDLSKCANVKSPKGFHFYCHKAPTYHFNYGLGCRRLSEFPIDLKWDGIMVAPSSEIDGKIYRELNGETMMNYSFFISLLRLEGIELQKYIEREANLGIPL